MTSIKEVLAFIAALTIGSCDQHCDQELIVVTDETNAAVCRAAALRDLYMEESYMVDPDGVRTPPIAGAESCVTMDSAFSAMACREDIHRSACDEAEDFADLALEESSEERPRVTHGYCWWDDETVCSGRFWYGDYHESDVPSSERLQEETAHCNANEDPSPGVVCAPISIDPSDVPQKLACKTAVNSRYYMEYGVPKVSSDGPAGTILGTDSACFSTQQVIDTLRCNRDVSASPDTRMTEWFYDTILSPSFELAGDLTRGAISWSVATDDQSQFCVIGIAVRHPQLEEGTPWLDLPGRADEVLDQMEKACETRINPDPDRIYDEMHR